MHGSDPAMRCVRCNPRTGSQGPAWAWGGCWRCTPPSGFASASSKSARENAEKALALLESHRPHRDVGHARLYLGAAWYGLGDLGQAVEWFLAAAAAYQEVGHAWGIGAALDNAGYVEFLRGNCRRGRNALEGRPGVARRTGSRYLLTGLYDHLAVLTAAQGDFVAALGYVAQCRQVLEEMDRPYIVASLSLSLSQIAMQAGDLTCRRGPRRPGPASGSRHRQPIRSGAFPAATRGCGGSPRRLCGGAAAYAEAAAVGQEIHAESLMVDVVAGLADRAWVMGRKTIATTLFRFVQSHPSASQETISRAAGRLDRSNAPPDGVHQTSEHR